MRELTKEDVIFINGGIKLHFNFIQAVFTVLGVSLINPVAGGVMICGLIATQGVGNLNDMYHEEFGG